jgi:hypothetical protein
MQTMIMVYKLKKEVSFEKYKKFSLEIDQPLVNSFEAVREFDIHFVIGPKKIWDIFEVIKVDSYNAWEEITQTDKMKNHDKEWKKYVDSASIKFVFGEKI